MNEGFTHSRQPHRSPTVPRRLLRAAVLLLAMAAIAPLTGPARAEAPSAPEYQLKAVFIYNFDQFVEWPEGAFAKSDSPLVITVLGDNPFGNVLEQVTRGKRIRGHEIVVHYAQDVARIGQTHVLFVAAPYNQNPAELLRGLTGVLTIGDTDNFAEAGGMIRFYSERSKLRFEINTRAAEKAGIRVSAKLLHLARTHNDD
jgi:hypothetical protein